MGQVSRRGFLVGSGSVAAAWALGRWLPSPRAASAALDRTWRTVVDPAGTTLEATIRRIGLGPWRSLGEGPGEPIVVRAELRAPVAGREDRRTAIAAFVHLTDQHLTDSQSPGRVEFLDPAHPLFQSAYRPQELLTTQVATSMVERINRLGRGPVSARPFDAAVCTGDNIDNQQVNEMAWLLAILDGGPVTPDSGQRGSYAGVQDGVEPGRAYWHPDEEIDDDYKATLGYPAVPGLLQRSLVPFSSPGLRIPWFSTYGNHDCNVQGNVARTDALDAIFTGDRKMTGLPDGDNAFAFILRVMGDSPSVLAGVRSGAIPSREVPADPGRRTATTYDWVAAHLASPTGHHGYTKENLLADRLYYEFELAPGVVGLSLDSTNHFGGPNGAGGSIGSGQLAWLEERLAAHHARYLAPDGSTVRGGGDDRLVVVFSHHTAGSMDATDPDPARPGERRVLGAELISVLVRYPNVIAWVNGHTHTNAVHAHRHPEGRAGGFWEVNTASHVDWPQQARVIEVVDNHDGTLSIFGTMVEHAAPVSVDRSAGDVLSLAGISRELGANDAQANPDSKAGAAEARNVELVVAAPFERPVVEPTTSTSGSTTSTTGPTSGSTAPASTSIPTPTAPTTTPTTTSPDRPGGPVRPAPAAQPVGSVPAYTG